jgi:hypothetical protein
MNEKWIINMDNMKIVTIVAVISCAPFYVDAGIYKWIDENGKVHYTQTPPPKEGTRASINTDTFNSIQTVKAPQIPKRTVRKVTTSTTTKQTSRKKIKKRTQVKRSRCSRL